MINRTTPSVTGKLTALSVALALGACAGAEQTPVATAPALEQATTTTALQPTTTTTTTSPTTTTSQPTTTTEAPVLAYTGVVGVAVGEADDPDFGHSTCYGLQGDDGQAYALAISPESSGMEWGAMVTADGERVRGTTTKEVVGSDIEDASTGEAVARAGDRVTIIVDRPPSDGGDYFSCHLPVLGVVSIEVHP